MKRLFLTIAAISCLTMFACEADKTDNQSTVKEPPQDVIASSCSAICEKDSASLDCPVGKTCSCHCDFFGHAVCGCY